jgi:hypothetical protein
LAIWGWVSVVPLSLRVFAVCSYYLVQSYGGFMTSKVVEADDGVFSVGMAVAPVTDWKFYGKFNSNEGRIL